MWKFGTGLLNRIECPHGDPKHKHVSVEDKGMVTWEERCQAEDKEAESAVVDGNTDLHFKGKEVKFWKKAKVSRVMYGNKKKYLKSLEKA